MDILKNLKLNTWYGITLYLGVLLVAAAIIFEIKFLENKHLFGLGLGAVLIGLSYLIAEKEENFIKPYTVRTGASFLITHKVFNHNFSTIILLLIGILLSGIFGFLIVKSLI